MSFQTYAFPPISAILVDSTESHSHKTPHAGIMDALALAAAITAVNRDTAVDRRDPQFEAVPRHARSCRAA